MKPVIGIISRLDVLKSGNKVMVVYKDIVSSIINSGGIPVGILYNDETNFDDLKTIIDKCGGIIFQGGDSFNKYDLKIIKYVYEQDIPTLGICLGMQLMGYFLEGKIKNIQKHLFPDKKYVHKVYIDKDSKLYKILGVDKIEVNSRHKDMLVAPKCDIVGISEDGVVEALEDKRKRFFVGVQWHPENMYSYDILEHKLFDYFILICRT